MDSENSPTPTKLRRDALLALIPLGVALWALFFTDAPPDVREWIWLTVRVGFVVLTGLNLAYCLWRWRKWSK